MGNKVATSPFPAYGSALALYNQAELKSIKDQFALISGASGVISITMFAKVNEAQSPYIRREVLPRLFSALDLKKNGVVTFEEYLCVLTVFRSGTLDNKLKCIFLMYDGTAKGGGGYLIKENLRQMIIDATLCTPGTGDASKPFTFTNTFHSLPISTLDAWIADTKLLAHSVVEAALIQYAVHPSKMDMQEFLAFANADGIVQQIIPVIAAMIEGA